MVVPLAGGTCICIATLLCDVIVFHHHRAHVPTIHAACPGLLTMEKELHDFLYCSYSYGALLVGPSIRRIRAAEAPLK